VRKKVEGGWDGHHWLAKPCATAKLSSNALTFSMLLEATLGPTG
jgi:hypothetical protein